MFTMLWQCCVIIIYSDIYVKSPYIRGNTLWKQLPSNIQQAKTKSEFKSMLTDDVLENVKI